MPIERRNGPRPKPLHERYVVDENGCWIWQGARVGPKRREYGNLKWGGRTRVAHQIYYEQFVGPIPPKHEVHHTCNQPLCVNPDHLEPITRLEHGRLNSRVRLSIEAAEHIRTHERMTSKLASQLAEQFGVNSRHIWKVHAGEVWDVSAR